MRKILVVEDDLDLAHNIQYMLSKAGFEVFLANNGIEGVAMAKHLLPDLIIMDIMLPGMQGADAVNMIKSHAPCKDIPVIFLTGLMSSKEEKMGMKTVFIKDKTYLAFAKPFDFHKLLEIIKKTLEST